MDATRWPWACALLIVAGLVGCSVDDDPSHVPSTREILRRVGRRLSGVESERALTAIATRGPELLARLNRQERAALGVCALRFEVDRPVVLDVAAPRASVPFWLEDRGFRATDLTLVNRDGPWTVYRRSFPAGRIGLGVNGLDRSPPAHYVVFVRGRDTTRAGRAVVTLDETSRSSWRTVTAEPAVSAAFDVDRPFTAIPDELADATLLQPSHSDRHDAILANGRVWKTHVLSSQSPDQVAISFGDDPAHSLVWTWRTSPEVISTVLRIAPVSASEMPVDRGVRVIKGDSAIVEVREVLNDPIVRRHRVAVEGLEPDRVYRYAIGDGTPDGWGPWKAVRTAPMPGRPFTFLYMGDAQTGLKGWGQLLEKAVHRHPETSFLILAGDLVDRGNERTNWDHFFLRAAPVLDRLPLMPCIGNHEYLDVGPRLYRAFFELPRNGPRGIDPDLVYSFEAGDACFAVLDSNMAVWDPDAARIQAEWLDRVYSRTRARWKLAVFHHPVYPAHPWRDMPALREFWVPVFDRHGVDLVLQGHDHSYQRSYPLRGHRRADGGTIYVVTVAGDKFVDQTDRDHVAVGFTHVSTYQTIAIDPASDRLTYRAWTEDGREVDAFEVRKPPREAGPLASRSGRNDR